jgi:hypothetical protein
LIYIPSCFEAASQNADATFASYSVISSISNLIMKPETIAAKKIKKSVTKTLKEETKKLETKMANLKNIMS